MVKSLDGVGVDGVFSADGRFHIHRIERDGTWTAVEQGRQWTDEAGRHVLVMLPGGRVAELLLRRDTLTWEIQQEPARNTRVV